MVITALGAALPGLAEAQVGEHDARSDGEEVRFRNGELELAGLWFTAPGEGPVPAAVVIRGSGESRRDDPWARLFVDVLLENGVAVLLPDRRGSGASEGDGRSATFTDLAEDALAAVRDVRSRPKVDPERVGLVGLSPGGLVGADTVSERCQQWRAFHCPRHPWDASVARTPTPLEQGHQGLLVARQVAAGDGARPAASRRRRPCP